MLQVDFNTTIAALRSIADGLPVEEKFLPRPHVNMPDLFSREDMKRARKYMNDIDKLLELVVRPRMEHINAITKQENDDRFWAYAVIYMLERNPKVGTMWDRDWEWRKSS